MMTSASISQGTRRSDRRGARLAASLKAVETAGGLRTVSRGAMHRTSRTRRSLAIPSARRRAMSESSTTIDNPKGCVRCVSAERPHNSLIPHPAPGCCSRYPHATSRRQRSREQAGCCQNDRINYYRATIGLTTAQQGDRTTVFISETPQKSVRQRKLT